MRKAQPAPPRNQHHPRTRASAGWTRFSADPGAETATGLTENTRADQSSQDLGGSWCGNRNRSHRETSITENPGISGLDQVLGGSGCGNRNRTHREHQSRPTVPGSRWIPGARSATGFTEIAGRDQEPAQVTASAPNAGRSRRFGLFENTSIGVTLGSRMPRCRMRTCVCWLYSTSVTAQPSRPARAVRPERCR